MKADSTSAPADLGHISSGLDSTADLEAIAVEMEGVSVAVVGAGPAGMVSAAQLLKHGASVTVFERSTGNEGSEGWNMTLGKTSKAAIEAAGLSPDFGPACRSGARPFDVVAIAYALCSSHGHHGRSVRAKLPRNTAND